MKTLLVILGLLALPALLMPDLVTVGLLMLIVPGLILSAAPTAFLYVAAFAIIRSLLPIQPGPFLNLAAGAATLALGAALTAPGHLAGRLAFRQALKPDVTRPGPVPLAGHVRLDRTRAPTRRAGDQDVPDCDALCAALLDTPGVTAVTLGGETWDRKPLPPVTYRLVPAAQAPDSRLAPSKPEEIAQALPDPPRSPGPDGWDAVIAARDALRDGIAARWALRLAGDERLVADFASAEPDIVLRIFDARVDDRHRVAVQEVEIADRHGVALFRRRRVTAQPLLTPFAIWPVSAGGLKLRWEVARAQLRHGARFHDFKPVETLFARTTLARPRIAEDGVTAMRDALAAATRRPDLPASDPVFALAIPWFKTLYHRPNAAADVALIGALIDDPRVVDLKALYDGWGKPDPSLRDAIFRRLLRADTPLGVRNRLDGLIRAMPPGTFARTTAAEAAFLRRQPLRLEAPALVERLADQGGAAAPLLVATLEEDARVDHWWRRQWVVAAIRRALIRLGPAAASELPDVERLVASGRLTNSSGDADDWRFALARMGKPVDQARFPDHFSAERLAKERGRLAERLARFHPDAELR